MKFVTLIGSVCAALGLLLPAAAVAQGAPATSETSAGSDRSVAFAAVPVDSATLASYRGGSEQVSNEMTLNGTTANNSANRVNTGDNTISAGSFANMNGLPVVIQNSGANVLIQNAVILHLQMN
ncbi:hypothetical protein QTI24_06705 [Variovorax sp. J22P240]|uniref:hypothetical protein n=1 Tax=Variovorax sp. J22P240 TaxID=3053514 RepID=UPI002578332A|nr:hypothetical protein [Variovorax sp. J22P240]MDL9998283.1 hypothetical protein [Variovorax sp. J22P240]